MIDNSQKLCLFKENTSIRKSNQNEFVSSETVLQTIQAASTGRTSGNINQSNERFWGNWHHVDYFGSGWTATSDTHYAFWIAYNNFTIIEED